MPVNVPKLVEKAYLRGADCICLDLEDSVPFSEKVLARSFVRQSISSAGKGGRDVLVRINNSSKEALVEDLRASIWPGLAGLIIPKVESPELVAQIGEQVGLLERERGIPLQSIGFWVVVESSIGVKNVSDIASASKRIEFIGIGDEDLALDLGITPTTEGTEFTYVKSKVIIAARAAGITPLGLAGTLSDFRDLDGLRISALKAKNMGFKGAMAIHPTQIPILNEAFSPTAEQVSESREIVSLFDNANLEGRAAIQFQGKMIDVPVYERARKTLELAKVIEEIDSAKRVIG